MSGFLIRQRSVAVRVPSSTTWVHPSARPALSTSCRSGADLAGCLITADALHCQRGHADFLAARGGHYLFTVKANQPTLRQALRRLPWATAPGSRRRNRGHGRSESR